MTFRSASRPWSMQSQVEAAKQLARWCELAPSSKVDVDGTSVKVIDAIETLLDNEPTILNAGVPTPLAVAVAQPKSRANKPLIKLLLERGAVVDYAVRAAVHEGRDEIVAMLNGPEAAGEASEAAKLLDLLCELCAEAPQACTSLPADLGGARVKIFAAVEKVLSCEAWQRLLKAGSVQAALAARPELPTPLQVAVAQPKSRANKPIIKLLLDRGAVVDDTVRAAVHEGRDEVIEMLDGAQDKAAKRQRLQDSLARAEDLERENEQRRQGSLSTMGSARDRHTLRCSSL